MLKHTIQVLEFEKIKLKLKNFVHSGLGKYKIDNIKFSNDIEEIIQSLREVTDLCYLFKNSSFPGLGIHDIRNELKRAKLENSYIDPEGLVKVNSTLRAIRKLKEYLKRMEEEAPSLIHYHQDLSTFKYIEDSINKAIDENNYSIKDSASKELSHIRNQIINYKGRIEKKLSDILRNKDYTKAIQESLITVREDRYVIPIKKDYKGRISGIVLDTSSSGNTLFMEPSAVIEDNNTLMSLLVEEKQEEIRILKKITSQITENWNSIHDNLDIISKFELLYAKSKLSNEMDCNEINVNNEGIFQIYKSRHPLLTGDVVPIDLKLGNDYNMLIITGPNTGGKTVSLKTLGLLTLMTMAGMHVPADKDSNISIVDNVYTDIGDEQSIQQNLSTFSSHIQRISKILRKASSKSLVLIDEIGAGTDPREGSSIGIAILEELLNRKSKVMVSTHFARIKNFGLRKKRVETASCEFDLKTLSPTYRILYGVPGESNAITIAKKLGLYWKVVKRANKLFNKSTDKSESVIKTLTQEKTKYTKLLEVYEQKIKELSDKEEKLRKRENIINEKENKIKKGKLSDTMDLIQKSRKDILNLIKEAKSFSNNQNNKELGKKIGEIDRISSKIKEEFGEDKSNYSEEIEETVENGEIQEGDSVKVKNLGKTGTVVNIDHKGDVTVQVGGIKFILPKSDLVKLNKETNKHNKKENDNNSISVTTSSNIYESPPFELNLIGMRGEEAVKKAENYIESLYYSDREFGRIVHGKGEGILRKLITDLLRKHSFVKKYSSASPDEGGFGVTEFTLKD